MTTRMFNVRVDDTLGDAIDDAAEAGGITRSVWAREVLGSVALGGVTLEDLRRLVSAHSNGGVVPSPHPARTLVLQGQIGRRNQIQAGCLHPATAIKHLPFTDVCGLCGETVRHR